MATAMFENVRGLPLPVLAFAMDGTAVQPDGLRFFTLDQAVGHFAFPQDVLSDFWNAAHGGQLTDDEGLDALQQIAFAHLSKDQVRAVFEYCKHRGFSAWHDHVWASFEYDVHTRRNALKIHIKIGGLLHRAHRTGDFLGRVAVQYCGPDGVWTDLWLKPEAPAAARVGIRKKSSDVILWGIATFQRYAQYTLSHSGEKVYVGCWATMPDVQLAKCALAAALRTAFDELAGLYIDAEMGQAKNPQLQPTSTRMVPLLAEGPTMQLSTEGADEIPTTKGDFDKLLRAEFGLETTAEINRTVMLLRSEIPFDPFTTAFFRRALPKLRKNPGLYAAAMMSV